ncbi:MAG: ParA family protein [Bacteroidota bacterium]
MANTIAIYNFKGGVGKTTSTLNLGYAWSRSFKVLLIDCDPQCNLSAAFNKSKETHTIFYYLKKMLHDHAPDKIDTVPITPYLHIIPGDFEMVNIETNNQFITFGTSIIQKLTYQVKKEFDIVIFDLPTHFGTLVKSFLANVDSILIPAIPDSFSISGVKTLLSYLYDVERMKPLNILGIFFNMYKRNLLHHQDKYRESAEEFKDMILSTQVRSSIKVAEASDIGRSINRINPDNNVAKDFVHLSDELLAKFNHKFLDKELLESGFFDQG